MQGDITEVAPGDAGHNGHLKFCFPHSHSLIFNLSSLLSAYYVLDLQDIAVNKTSIILPVRIEN